MKCKGCVADVAGGRNKQAGGIFLISFTDCGNLLLCKIVNFRVWKGVGEELSRHLNPFSVPSMGKCSFEEDR